MQIGDKVVPTNEPDVLPLEVMDIEDLGYGEGNERVTVSFLGFHRCYAKKELKVVERLTPEKLRSIKKHLDHLAKEGKLIKL